MELSAIEEAKQKYSTPSYIFDEDILSRRIDLIRRHIGDRARICYAMKANPFLVKSLDKIIDCFEVCSPGEYEICNRMNISPDKIVISGVNKTLDSMERIVSLSQGHGIYTIESPEHMRILSHVATEYNISVKVIIRLSSGNQFGVDKKTLEDIIKSCMADEHIVLTGIHYYSGTQKKLKKIEKEITELNDYFIELKNRYNITGLNLEYGPGLGAAYFTSDKPVDDCELLDGLAQILDGAVAFDHVTVEMGRFIASQCGYYLTTVMDVKHTEEDNYLIVDGGIHQLNYYGQIMGMKQPFMDVVPKRENNGMKWTICGSLCTVNDVIVKEVPFGDVHIGDYIVFHNCGAYSVTEGMALFLSRNLPQVIIYSAKDGFSQVRKPVGTHLLNSYMMEEM